MKQRGPDPPPHGDRLLDVSDLFLRERHRLSRTVNTRLDHRLAARLDCDDVLQEAFIEISRRIGEFRRHPTIPFYVWARQITLQVLIDIQRRHLGTRMRDVRVEVSFAAHRPTSSSMDDEPIGPASTPSTAALRLEAAGELHRALSAMRESDREILIMRHFEEMTNKEVAAALGLDISAACQRYLRALTRLRSKLSRQN